MAQRRTLNILTVAGIAVAVLLVAFIAWRWTSVARGVQQCDKRLVARLDPIGKKIDAGEAVSPQEIESLTTPRRRLSILESGKNRQQRVDASGALSLAYPAVGRKEGQRAIGESNATALESTRRTELFALTFSINIGII